jgi:hypothetical protein
MPARDFKFISPGVFINEIDNSTRTRTPGDIGPVIIGRSRFGPALYPTRIESFQEFTQVFGAPMAGVETFDVARSGVNTGPTYGAYAAQAWLRNNSPVTFVRLVGQQNGFADDDGEAGWRLTNPLDGDSVKPYPGANNLDAGGAYGLFVFQSSSAGLSETTGTLAAVWYCTTGSVALSGTVVSATGSSELLADTNGTNTADASGAGTNIIVRATADKEFKVIVLGTDGETEIESKFNFSQTSEDFVRKVFNTNPTLTNTTITDSASAVYRPYWLGESYEDEVAQLLTGSAADQYGVIIPLFRSDEADGGDFKRDFSDPATGYFIGQDLTDNSSSFDAADMPKLFRLRARNTGRWTSKNVKVSISDIRASDNPNGGYGTFSVQVRAMNDTDNRPKVLEQFNNCNLNPGSPNFIARKVGDRYVEWDDTDRRWREYGDYPNLSQYFYVDMTDELREGKLATELLPFGVFGMPQFAPFSISGSGDIGNTNSLVTGAAEFSGLWQGTDTLTTFVSGTENYDIEFKFPTLRQRVSASEGNPTNPKNVYFGVDSTFNRTGRPASSIGDYTGPKPSDVDMLVADTGGDADTVNSYIFTLDDMCINQTSGDVALSGTLVYKSGSRQDVDGATGDRDGLLYVREAPITSGSYREVLALGANAFTTVFHGGYDGLDITEAEPFRNTFLEQTTTQTELNNYAVNSIRVAIDAVRDPEAVEFDIAAMPGITNNTLNRSLVDMCEDRGDALAIIDLQGGYVPETENTLSVSARIGSVDDTVNNKRQSLQIDSSFGCAYYPWVQIQDTFNGTLVWAPPSVAAIGAMSYGQATQELWFAPAGFTRGGLSANNAAGLPVVGVRERLVAKDRDNLYEASINPIAQFPSEGIVIFGQKTLQITPSALDRINVRRLMIFLKKQISRIAATLLFDQNVQVTWNRFKGQVEPLLDSVRARLGLTDYKLVLDETTTTPDLVDRNIMYAQIFLKPARAIEFIAIDFVITDSGASFED